MESERNALKAGLFMVFSFFAIVGVVVGIKGAGGVVQPMQDLRASFRLTDDVGGLRAGDDVRVGGFKVGSVRGIDADVSGSEPRIVVTFKLPQKYVLHEDAHVAVQSTLTGQASLNIDSLGTGMVIDPAKGVVAGRPGAMAALFRQLGEAAPELAGIVHDVRGITVPRVNDAVATFRETGRAATDLVRHVDAKVDPAVEKYNGVADKAAGAMGEVKDILGDTKGDVRGTIAHLNAATGTIKDKLPGLLDQVHGVLEKVDGSLVSARAALEDVRKTAANARDLTGSARSLVVDNKGKVDHMIAALKATSDNLKAASVEVRHSPWRLLYKPGPNEMANLNVYDAARQFADGAGAVDDAATALRDALRDPQADREQVQKLMQRLDATFAEFHAVEQKLVTAVRE